jgi:hypothetical protein
MGRTKNGEAPDLAAVQKLAHDEGGFYGFTDTHVVGNKETDDRHLEGHEEGYELVSPGLHRDMAETAEGPCRRTELETKRVAEEKARTVRAGATTIRRGEGGALHGGEFKLGEDDLYVLVAPSQGTKAKGICVVVRLDNPFAVTNPYERAGREAFGA